MNERIRELKKQATDFYLRDETLDCSITDLHELVEQKFAELIVKDCLQQCEQIRNDALTQKKSEFLTESGKLLYEGVFGGATNCGFAIQQHFGVEE